MVADAMLDPQVLLEPVRDSQGRVVDFLYVEVNRATCEYLGLSRDELLGDELMSRSPGIAEVGLFAEYVRCLDTGEPVVHNDFTYDNEILADTRRYDIRATRATPNAITLTWRDVTERFQTAQDAARADALFRRLMESSTIGMGLFGISGQFDQVNAAMCDFFGYDLETLRTKTWQELTAPEYLDADLKQVDEVLAGHIESYRMEKQYIYADGHPIWGDLSVSCLRTPGGEVEFFVVQIVNITAVVASRTHLAARDEQNRQLAKQLQATTDRLTEELGTAATYVSSIQPGDLHDGPVRVTARYLPTEQLAGDSFDFRWIDDDHLLVYLIDVSGHGIGPALLSVSVHNLLRSGSLPLPTLHAPEEVLAQLNHLFQMDDHDGNYLTMWCGVYELSTRTLRYASAGAPPAFAITPDATAATELSTDGQPLGMFDDAAYNARSYTVPPGCRVLIFSDGAYESARDHGHQLSVAGFNTLFTRLAGSPLDDLIETLRGLTPSGTFDDDCTLVNMAFD
ncbi:MAG TPA: SpoIIE family protein phosphatase [Mycobacterium sp.]|nr:SpoIIE family protein phosphatase [Mycobacterium sp.]